MMAMEHTKDCEWRTKYNVSHTKDSNIKELVECECDCHRVSS